MKHGHEKKAEKMFVKAEKVEQKGAALKAMSGAVTGPPAPAVGGAAAALADEMEAVMKSVTLLEQAGAALPKRVLQEQEQHDPAAHPSQAKISVAAVDVIAVVVDVVDVVQAPADVHRAMHAPAPFADAELVEPLPAEQQDPPPPAVRTAPFEQQQTPAAFGLPEDWAQQLSALTEMMGFEPVAVAAALLEQRGNVQLAVAQLIG